MIYKFDVWYKNGKSHSFLDKDVENVEQAIKAANQHICDDPTVLNVEIQYPHGHPTTYIKVSRP